MPNRTPSSPSSSPSFVRAGAVCGLLAFAGLLPACGQKQPALDVQPASSQSAQPAASGADAPPAPIAAHGSTTGTDALPAGHPPIDGGPATAPPLEPGATMPPGHPPLGGGTAMQPGGMLPPVDPNAGTGQAALAWTAPASWQSVPPTSSMRRAQYRVPGPGGDAECVVFYFGPGQGGDPQSNAQRWAAQFAGADGKPALDTLKTREIAVGSSKVLMVEANGTYQPGAMMGGPDQPQPGWALLGAIAQGPDANWFFKLTGPGATIEAERANFDALLQSLKSGT